MIFPETHPAIWALLYGLEDRIPEACKNCGELQHFNIPFAHGSFRGFLSDHTKCGDEFRQAVFVTKAPEERRTLGEFVKQFCAGTLEKVP